MSDNCDVVWAVLSKGRTGDKAKQLRGKDDKLAAIRKPTGRVHHVACVVDERYLLVHGGVSNGLRPITCCWALDLSTSTWNLVGEDSIGLSAQNETCHSEIRDLVASVWHNNFTDTKIEDKFPSARYGHSLTYFAEQRLVLLLGGLDTSKRAVANGAFFLKVPDEFEHKLVWNKCHWACPLARVVKTDRKIGRQQRAALCLPGRLHSSHCLRRHR